MQIELKGRNVPVTDDLREHVEKRFRKISNQVPDVVRMEVEFAHENNPSIAERECAEVTLYLKGKTLRAHDHARDLHHAINLCEKELCRQVKQYREKRRHRREARTSAAAGRIRPAL
jgi:putative sigma-54 modulation protein